MAKIPLKWAKIGEKTEGKFPNPFTEIFTAKIRTLDPQPPGFQGLLANYPKILNKMPLGNVLVNWQSLHLFNRKK